MRFAHEGLDAYRLSLEVARWIGNAAFPRGVADLKDQGHRAARSVVLNIAEGRSRNGRARSNHYSIARGSAAETCSVLDLVDLPQGAEQQDKLRRVNQMLRNMGG
ncbi:MAG: four helix bundle protein [Deltaproteobacteria bacterium]|nr:four helix bundle protein [Deltaproteobacteria bacterium]